MYIKKVHFNLDNILVNNKLGMITTAIFTRGT